MSKRSHQQRVAENETRMQLYRLTWDTYLIGGSSYFITRADASNDDKLRAMDKLAAEVSYGEVQSWQGAVRAGAKATVVDRDVQVIA